ncbi:hypothetical protein THIX_50013 [Thiomonas sp. X19]|nr:hypothetical protein THIX_50013 [Thiomonas sp. X19]
MADCLRVRLNIRWILSGGDACCAPNLRPAVEALHARGAQMNMLTGDCWVNAPTES